MTTPGSQVRPGVVPHKLTSQRAHKLLTSNPVIPRVVATWRIAGRVIVLDRPIVVGVLNVTPDSFSDGGRFAAVDAAVTHVESKVAEGADINDIGGDASPPQGPKAGGP